MPDLLLIGFTTMLVAGAVKGMVGMGMPSVGIGVLSLVLPPTHAAAVLIVPIVVTNVWQFAAGPGSLATALRFGPMMAMLMLGTLVSGILFQGLSSPLALPTIGGVMCFYGLLGLFSVPLIMPARWEKPLGPLIGFLTGLVNGLTGFSMLPSVPFLRSVGLNRDQMIQALGLNFSVSGIALGTVLTSPSNGAPFSDPRLILASVAALGPALIGMEAGKRLRGLASPAVYARVFFGGIVLLGGYMVLRGLLHAFA